MANTKTVFPTDSYAITVPIDINEDVDQAVVSFWKTNEQLLLQLSSIKRFEGQQLGAKQRLQDRLYMDEFAPIREEQLIMPSCPETAAALIKDSEGIEWIYCYAVWHDLSIFITISGLSQDVRSSTNWARLAVSTIKRKGADFDV